MWTKQWEVELTRHLMTRCWWW